MFDDPRTWEPFDGSGPDVNPATGDEAETTDVDPGDQLYPWLESDDEFEGVGAHVDNPRFDLDTALADQAEADATP